MLEGSWLCTSFVLFSFNYAWTTSSHSLVNVKEAIKQANIYVGRFLTLRFVCFILNANNYARITLSHSFYWLAVSAHISTICILSGYVQGQPLKYTTKTYNKEPSFLTIPSIWNMVVRVCSMQRKWGLPKWILLWGYSVLLIVWQRKWSFFWVMLSFEEVKFTD